MPTKNCVKGYSCGGSCISRKDNCIKNLTPEMNEKANNLFKLIQDQQADFEGLSRGQKSVRTKKQAQFNDHLHAKKYLEYHQRMRDIEETKDEDQLKEKLKGLKETPWASNPIYSMFNGGSLANEEAYKKKRVESDKIAEEMMKTLPAKLVREISEKGNPCARPIGKRAPYCDKKGKERKELLNERGKAILSNYLMFDMKDPITGEVASWRDLQPDHIIPQSVLGAEADTSENLNIVYGAYNQVKKANEWSSVNASLEKVSTKEGFEERAKVSESKALKNAEDQQKHYDNLSVLKDTDDKDKKEQYLLDTTPKSVDTRNVLRGLASAIKGVPPEEYQAPRPFRDKKRGSSVWGPKNAMLYINKRLLGLDDRITDKERTSFERKLAQSNIIREQDPNKKLITEESIMALYTDVDKVD